MRQGRTEAVRLPRLDEAPSGFACLRGHLHAEDVAGMLMCPHQNWSSDHCAQARRLLVVARRINVSCLMIPSSLIVSCPTHPIWDACTFGSRCHVRMHLHGAQLQN